MIDITKSVVVFPVHNWQSDKPIIVQVAIGSFDKVILISLQMCHEVFIPALKTFKVIAHNNNDVTNDLWCNYINCINCTKIVVVLNSDIVIVTKHPIVIVKAWVTVVYTEHVLNRTFVNCIVHPMIFCLQRHLRSLATWMND